MNLTRSGAQRNAGTALLFTDDVTNRKIGSPNGPRYRDTSATFVTSFVGEDRNSTYNYVLTISASEIVKLLRSAVISMPDKVSRSILESHIAGIKVLLEPQPKVEAKEVRLR